ncbi:MAG: aminodeoxychorismate synthase component I [Sphingobacteriia bacterium]|nr:aminodeoxychorismate synthase component I [Candidatus Fonsibacter lacus]
MKSIMNQWGKEHIPFVFLIDFECKKPMCWKWSETENIFQFNFDGVTNLKKASPQNYNIATSAFEFIKMPISFEEYKYKFDQVKKEIEIGNSFLVNLTAKTKINSNYTIAEIFSKANAKYTCYLKDTFVCFSPETFIKIKDGKLFSYPMKGTINAGIPDAKNIILNDPKEISEHATMVDLIRNDLSRVSKNVKVNRYRYYEEIVTQDGKLGQVSSEIIGELAANYCENIGEIIFDLLPAGSISGAPKQKTIQIIAAAEKEDRGYYTGIAGYYDGTNLDSTVLIRYLQNDQYYRSGGGITCNSDALNEYQEMIDKVYVPLF